MNSIRARMTVVFSACLAAILLVGVAGLIAHAHLAARRDADAVLGAAMARFRSEANDGRRASALAEMREETEELRANGVAMLVVDHSGRVIAQSQNAIPLWPPTGDSWRTRSVAIGDDTVVVGVPWERTERAIRSQAASLFGLSLVAVLAVSIGAWALVGRTLSPISALSRQAKTSSADTLQVRLTAPSEDAEVVDLVDTLNGLLRRLEDASASRGRFYAAASHELRTPLQALQGHLEVGLSRERSAQEYRETLEESCRQAERLSALVRDLLTLNRLHTGAADPGFDSVDVADICAHSVNALSGLAESRAVSITVDLPDRAEVIASSASVEMLVRNLIENAVKYADRGGGVSVALTAAPAMRLEVFNECTLTERLDMGRLFEPFYRPDASRNAESGGNGLGLAICRSVADIGGWTISLEQEEGGVRAVVAF